MGYKAYLYLIIEGQDLQFDEISEKLSCMPQFSYKRGETFYDRFERCDKTQDKDCLMFYVETNENEDFERCLEAFVEKVYVSKEVLNRISQKNDVIFKLSVYPEKVQCLIPLAAKTISRLAEMGASVVIDSMFLKEFYEG